jgi:hypothetical protein
MLSKSNVLREIWAQLVDPATHPRRMRNFHIVSYDFLQKKLLAQDIKFCASFAENLYCGDVYLAKGAFAPESMQWIVKSARKFIASEPKSFHLMEDGAPNFHQAIDHQLSAKYYASPIKHSSYFFRWNSQSPTSVELFERCNQVWRILKIIGGLDPYAYEGNIPSDGIVDRIQVVRYPWGGGKIDCHSDPYLTQNIVSSGYMSKRGVHYDTGGAYYVDANDSKVDMEEHIDVGDIGFSFPTIAHGVDPVDPHKELRWEVPEGRWWLGLFSNISNMVKDRHTGKEIVIEFKDQKQVSIGI